MLVVKQWLIPPAMVASIARRLPFGAAWRDKMAPCPPALPPHASASTIALVDDDRNILTSVSIALQAEGFVVRMYSDGDTALRGLLENPPDLAVLDIKMPRMDGMEVLRRLREKSQVPVIFLTSKDTEIDEALGLAMGADDYIGKPFSQRLLIERIRAVLRRVANRNAPAESAERACRRVNRSSAAG